MGLPQRVVNPLLGKHLTSVILTPLTIAEDGTNTAGTPVTLSAKIDGLNSSIRMRTSEVSSINSVRQNHVKEDDGVTFSLRIFKVNDGTDPDPLETMRLSYDYARCVWKEGTGSSEKTKTLYFLMSDITTGNEGKGKQIASINGEPVDFGSSTFAKA